MTRPARVGIVGGGILGTTLALRLAQAGAEVTLLERGPSLGGLAGRMELGGHPVDRFYHVITPADRHMLAMADELGLADRVRFSRVGSGFFVDGGMHDFNGAGDLLRFDPLSRRARLRLAWFFAQCQLRRSHRRLDSVPLQGWLRRHCGREVLDRIWRPLLDSRFEGDPEGLPATYIWARTRRMSGTREEGGGETMGHLIGGHQVLIEAMGARARALGAELLTAAPVEGLTVRGDGSVAGVELTGRRLDFDLTILTVQPQVLRFLLPERHHGLLEPYPRRWQGVVCAVLRLPRSILPYYAVNIAEPTPVTTAVETTQVLGTEEAGGAHLVYLPRYCAPDAPEQSEDEESVYLRFSEYLRRLVPDFRREEVLDWTVQRARLVEPVHTLRPDGGPIRTAPIWPGVDGLALVSNAQVYPQLLNGDSVMGFAEAAAGEIAPRLPSTVRPRPAARIAA